MSELLEMQGATPDMVRDYLRGKGWTRNEAGDLSKSGECWHLANGTKGMCWLHDKSPRKTVESLARMEQRHVQEIAAEVNPRMRPWPTEEAVKEHESEGGQWLCKKPNGGGLRVMTFSADHTEDDPVMASDDFGDYWQCDCEGWRFWPCDANGNKVKWPTNGQGEML